VLARWARSPGSAASRKCKTCLGAAAADESTRAPGWRSCAPGFGGHCDQLVACGTLPVRSCLQLQLGSGLLLTLQTKFSSRGKTQPTQAFQFYSAAFLRTEVADLERRVVRTLSPA